MEVRKVSSSNIDQIGYDVTAKLLRVVFMSGKVYDYTGVDQQTYDNLMQHPSKGQFFNRVIQGNFECRRIA